MALSTLTDSSLCKLYRWRCCLVMTLCVITHWRVLRLAQAMCKGALDAAATAGKANSKGPAKLELVLGRKWSIENHEGNRNLIIDQTDPKQSVYIFNCSNCTVQVCLKAVLASQKGCLQNAGMRQGSKYVLQRL